MLLRERGSVDMERRKGTGKSNDPLKFCGGLRTVLRQSGRVFQGTAGHIPSLVVESARRIRTVDPRAE